LYLLSLCGRLPHERTLVLRRWRRRAVRWLTAGWIHTLYRLLGRLPRGAALRTCQLLGRVTWSLDTSGRRTSLTNLERAFGDRITRQDRVSIGRSAYINLAAGLADLSRVKRLGEEDLADLVPEGTETLVHIHRAVQSGRGIVLLTPHLGNWELLTAYLASRGAPVHFVGRPPYDPRLESLFEEVRCRHGAQWVRRGGAFDHLRDLLEGGELVILLSDQDSARVRGTWVPFFGHPAWTPTGPVALARLTGAALIPGALLRRSDHRYRILLEPPIRMTHTGDAEYDDWENTRRSSLALESLIERYPAQWVWFHRRWRTRPQSDWSPPPPPGREGPDLVGGIRPLRGD